MFVVCAVCVFIVSVVRVYVACASVVFVWLVCVVHVSFVPLVLFSSRVLLVRLSVGCVRCVCLSFVYVVCSWCV